MDNDGQERKAMATIDTSIDTHTRDDLALQAVEAVEWKMDLSGIDSRGLMFAIEDLARYIALEDDPAPIAASSSPYALNTGRTRTVRECLVALATELASR